MDDLQRFFMMNARMKELPVDVDRQRMVTSFVTDLHGPRSPMTFLGAITVTANEPM